MNASSSCCCHDVVAVLRFLCVLPYRYAVLGFGVLGGDSGGGGASEARQGFTELQTGLLRIYQARSHTTQHSKKNYGSTTVAVIASQYLPSSTFISITRDHIIL